MGLHLLEQWTTKVQFCCSKFILIVCNTTKLLQSIKYGDRSKIVLCSGHPWCIDIGLLFASTDFPTTVIRPKNHQVSFSLVNESTLQVIKMPVE